MAFFPMKKKEVTCTQFASIGTKQFTGTAKVAQFTIPKGKWIIFISIGWSDINAWFYLNVNGSNVIGTAPYVGGGSSNQIIITANSDVTAYFNAPSLTTQTYTLSNVSITGIQI